MALGNSAIQQPDLSTLHIKAGNGSLLSLLETRHLANGTILVDVLAFPV